MATYRKRRGKWQVQVRREGQPALSRTFTYRKDAQAWARDIEAKQERGFTAVDTRPLRSSTVDDLLERYARTVTVTKRGAEVEAIRIGRMRRSDLAKLSLAAATPDKFAEYRDQRLTEVAPATVRKEMALLRHMFRIARQEWNLPLPANPLAELKAPPPGLARNRRLSNEEASRLLKALGQVRNPLVPAVVRFALETAMRRGEILKLRREHVNLPRRTVLIPETKNGHPRTIPLSSAAIAVLEGLEMPGDGLVFPLTPNALRLSWQRACRRAKVPNFHFHDLRHEAISHFFESGLTVPEVALISGHKDVRMLFRYTHLKAEDVATRLTSIERQSVLSEKNRDLTPAPL